ncbi:GntR family transcriptional regulator [Streptomyces xinghaiensis]|uniref:GntR family transcriptional regulator n=1 Tax=Streptomyces xinghaiensis TaxID=1038928 RepID=UPI003416E756
MSRNEWVSTSLPYLAARPQGQRDAWTEEADAAGRRGTQRIAQAGEVLPPPVVSDLLGLPAEEPVVVRRRIMYLDDRPTELTDTYYPGHIALGTRLASPAKIPGGAVALLAELGHEGRRVREDVTARLPTSEERDSLSLGEHEPVLTLTRLTLDSGDRPIQVDMMTMPAHLQRLRYELRIG